MKTKLLIACLVLLMLCIAGCSKATSEQSESEESKKDYPNSSSEETLNPSEDEKNIYNPENSIFNNKNIKNMGLRKELMSKVEEIKPNEKKTLEELSIFNLADYEDVDEDKLMRSYGKIYTLNGKVSGNIHPVLTFTDKNIFTLVFSESLSEPVIGGSYRVEGDTLYLTAFTSESYIFKIENYNTLIFTRQESPGTTANNSESSPKVPENAVFKLVEEFIMDLSK